MPSSTPRVRAVIALLYLCLAAGTANAGQALSPASAGCPANTLSIPGGANQTEVPDLDGDGQGDVLWMASGNRLGVTTHGGATFSTTYQTAEASQVGARTLTLGDGTPMILFGGSRFTKLYAVRGCHIVPTLNKQGKQYAFDNGFATEGSGWGCMTVDGRLRLVGLQITSTGEAKRYAITRTLIEVRDHGASARNGTRSQVFRGLSHDEARAHLARRFECPASERVMDP